MSTIKNFYKDATTEKFMFVDEQGGINVVVAGSARLKTDAGKTKLWLYEGREQLGAATITEVAKTAPGVTAVYYSGWDDFVLTNKDFYAGGVNVDFTALIAAVQSSGGSQLKAFTVEITRPANTTVYTANDVVADVTAAFLPFLNVAKAIGAGIKIVRVRIQTEDTGVAGKKFNLHLYREAPTFIADNAVFAINYSNASKRIGAIPVVMGAGNLGTVGMNDYNQVIINPISRDVYFILETVDGFTPSANSTRFQITIDCELSN